MTDNEIIKAWEKCSNPANDCYGDDYTCPYSTGDKGTGECFNKLREDVTGLINRQQEQIKKLENIERFATKTIEKQDAEIERLQSKVKKLGKEQYDLCSQIVNLKDDVKYSKSEAIKEFANLFKNTLCKEMFHSGANIHKRVDNLVKEMTENITKVEHNSLCETETYKGSE